MNKLKMLGILGIIILVANISLFAFRVITPLVFWMVIGVMALFVYFALPWIK